MPGILDLIKRWTDRAPDSLAVELPGRKDSLTYLELWERSGWLAAQLVAAGVRPGDLVGVDLQRGIDLVVAFVAVIRAGAAYLPLDEQAPAERISAIFDEAGVGVAVSTAQPRVRMPGLTLVNVPREAPALPVPQVSRCGEDTIYVTYTSGSTGRPKGVVVPHRGIVRLVEGQEFCPIRPADRVASTCNPAFDVIGCEIWGALAAGATIVPFPSFVAVGLESWLRLIRDERITTMFLTTSVFHTAAREQPDGFATLRDLVVAGEQLDHAATLRVLEAGAPARLVNGYGPTEASVLASYYVCTEAALADLARIPIGRALAQTDLYVLDDELAAVPLGEIGELCIGGPGVANGYLRRPQITAERFVNRPGTDEVVYRTGDLVRELPDGMLEFLGRRDRQVKIRGFRVELAEIEHAALDTGLVDAAFVEIAGDGAAVSLVGLVLPRRPEGAVDPTGAGDADNLVDTAADAGNPLGLAQRLAAVLPAYMVPHRGVVLRRVPIGPTGKADRAALAQLAREHAWHRSGPAELDPAVAALVGIVGDALAIDAVPVESSFVELGGNSIDAVIAAHRISRELRVSLTPIDLLNADSLRELGARLSGSLR